MAEKITLETILKITELDTGDIASKLSKLANAGQNGNLPFTSERLNLAKETLNTIIKIRDVSKQTGVNLSTQAAGLNNLLNRLDRNNNLNTKYAAVASEIEKIVRALGKGEISGKKFDKLISGLKVDLGNPQDFGVFVKETIAKVTKELNQSYNKEANKIGQDIGKKISKGIAQGISFKGEKLPPAIILDIEARGGVDKLRARKNEQAIVEAKRVFQSQANDAEAARKRRAEIDAAFDQRDQKRAEESAKVAKTLANDKFKALKDIQSRSNKELTTEQKLKQAPSNKVKPPELTNLEKRVDVNKILEEDDKRILARRAASIKENEERQARVSSLIQSKNQAELNVIEQKIALERKLLRVREEASRVGDKKTVGNIDSALSNLNKTTIDQLLRRSDEVAFNTIGNRDIGASGRNRLTKRGLNQAFGEVLNNGGVGGGSGGGAPPGGSPSNDPDKLFRDSNKRIAEAKKLLDQATTSANDFGKAMGLALRRFIAFQIGATALYAVVGVLRAGFEEALKFEEQLTAVQQALDGIDTRKLSDSIRNEARKTGTATAELATGIKTLAQAGFDDIGELEVFAERLAKVPLVKSFDGIQQTVDGLLAVFGQFNLKGQDTARVLDQINQFSKDFAVESKDIFAGVTKAGASFSIAGGSLEEFIQLFTVLRSSTRESGEVLGTFFKTGLNQLFRPTSQNLLKQLGIDTNQSIINQLRELGKLLDSPSFNKLEKLEIGRQLLDDSRQFPRLLALIRQLADDTQFDKLQKAAGNAFGSFDRGTVERINDVGFSLNRIKTILGDTLNSLVENGGFRSLVKSVADLTSALSPLLRILAQISPLLIAFGTLSFSSKIGQTLKNVGQTLAFGVGKPTDIDVIGNEKFGLPLNLRAERRRRVALGRGLPNLIGGGAAAIAGISGSLLSGGTSNIGQNLTTGNLGSAISGGTTIGLLVGAFNPLLGAVTGLTAAFINLAQSAKENYEINQRNKVANVDISRQNASKELTNLFKEGIGNKSRGFLGDLTTSLSDDLSGEVATRRLLKGNFAQRAILETSPLFQALTAQRRIRLSGQSDQQVLGAAKLQEVINGTGSGPAITDAISKQAQIERQRQGKSATTNSVEQALFDQFKNQGISDDSVRSIIGEVFEKIEFKIEKTLNTVSFDGLKIDNAKLNNIFTSIVNALEPINKKLIKSFDELESIVTDFTANPTLRGSSNDIDTLNKAFGSNIFTELDQQANRFADVLIAGLSNNAVRQALADVKSEDTSSTAETVLNSLNLGDSLTKEFKDIINVLAISKGQGADATLSELGKSVNIKKTVEGFNDNIEQVREALIGTVKKQIDLINKELSIRSSLNNKLVELANQTLTAIEEISQSRFESQDRSLEGSQFGKNLPGFIADQQRAALLQAQSQTSSFGSSAAFAQEFKDFQEALIDSSREVENINRGGANGFSSGDRQAVLENERNRKNFAIATGELNVRLNETRDRLGKAAQATDLLRQAAVEFRNELESAGQAVTQYTVQDLAQGIAVFNKFLRSSGGGKNVSQGLNSISSREFNTLTDLLGKLGNIQLGNGLSGANLLKDINQSLGLRFAATIKSSLSGRSVDAEEQGLKQELAKMTASAEAASAAEQKLREDLKNLLDINLNATVRETEAIERQIQALEAFSQNTIFADLNKTLQDLKNVIKPLSERSSFDVPKLGTPTDFEGNISKSVFKRGSPISNIGMEDRRQAQSIFDLVKPSGLSQSIIPTKDRFNGYATRDEMYKAQGLAKQQEMEKARAERIAARDGPREAERLNRIKDLLQRKPYLRNQIGQRDLDALEGKTSAVGTNQGSDKTAQSTNDPSRGLADASAKQIDVLNSVITQLNTLNQTSNVIKSTLETIASGAANTKFSLEVSPMQVNVALSAPDILKLAGKQLADNVIAAIAPAISQAFGVVSEEAKSVFEGSLGSKE